MLTWQIQFQESLACKYKLYLLFLPQMILMYLLLYHTSSLQILIGDDDVFTSTALGSQIKAV